MSQGGVTGSTHSIKSQFQLGCISGLQQCAELPSAQPDLSIQVLAVLATSEKIRGSGIQSRWWRLGATLTLRQPSLFRQSSIDPRGASGAFDFEGLRRVLTTIWICDFAWPDDLLVRPACSFPPMSKSWRLNMRRSRQDILIDIDSVRKTTFICRTY